MGSGTDTHFSSGIARLSKNILHRNSSRNGDKLIRFGIEMKFVSVSFDLSASYSFTDVGHATPVTSSEGLKKLGP